MNEKEILNQLDKLVIKTADSLPKLPVTALDWRLYSTMLGVEIVARQMTADLVKATKLIDANPTLETTKKVYKQLLKKVLYKYDNFGAADSEPIGVLASYLGKYLVAKVGFGDWDEIADELYY
jgi:hypothetical protein